MRNTGGITLFFWCKIALPTSLSAGFHFICQMNSVLHMDLHMDSGISEDHLLYIMSHRRHRSLRTKMSLTTVVEISLLLLICFCFLIKSRSLSSIPSASPSFPIIGNAISYRKNPIQFLRSQQARLGDTFMVNLGIIRVVYFLGPQGVNAVLRGTENSGVSMFAAACHMLGGAFEKCIVTTYILN